MIDSRTPDPVASVQALYERILRAMWVERYDILIATILSLIAATAYAFAPWVIRAAIDGVLLGDTLEIWPFGPYLLLDESARLTASVVLALSFFGIMTVGAVSGSVGYYLYARAALSLVVDLRGKVLSKLRALSMDFHSHAATGDLLFRAIDDARGIQNVMGFGIQAWLIPIFQGALMISLMFVLNWRLTLVVLATLPLLAFAIRSQGRRARRYAHLSREEMSKMTSLIEQTINNIRVMKSFGREPDEGARYEDQSRRYVGAQLRFRHAEQVLLLTAICVTAAGTAGVLAIGVRSQLAGALTLGSLWIFISYMQRGYELLEGAMASFGLYQDSLAAVGRAFALLDERPEIQDKVNAIDVTNLASSITLSQVSLHIDGESVLTDISLEIPRGGQVAFVGPTGAGKSSVLSLISRDRDPTLGEVAFDGVDLRDIRLESVKSLTSVVLQSPLLFPVSIAENIRFGLPHASEIEIERAAKLASAHDFISSLPWQYETIVGARGETLSVGEQQRLALARAILRDAPILLLDEPTSALDPVTEAEVMRSLQGLRPRCTIFVVAHRLSTIRNSDLIVVMDEGRVVETGVHETLIGNKGLYHKLCQNQEVGSNVNRV